MQTLKFLAMFLGTRDGWRCKGNTPDHRWTLPNIRTMSSDVRRCLTFLHRHSIASCNLTGAIATGRNSMTAARIIITWHVLNINIIITLLFSLDLIKGMYSGSVGLSGKMFQRASDIAASESDSVLKGPR